MDVMVDSAIQDILPSSQFHPQLDTSLLSDESSSLASNDGRLNRCCRSTVTYSATRLEFSAKLMSDETDIMDVTLNLKNL